MARQCFFWAHESGWTYHSLPSFSPDGWGTMPGGSPPLDLGPGTGQLGEVGDLIWSVPQGCCTTCVLWKLPKKMLVKFYRPRDPNGKGTQPKHKDWPCWLIPTSKVQLSSFGQQIHSLSYLHGLSRFFLPSFCTNGLIALGTQWQQNFGKRPKVAIKSKP